MSEKRKNTNSSALNTHMLPLQIFPQKLSNSTLDHLEGQILACSDLVPYEDPQGVWRGHGLVANHHIWNWDDPDCAGIKTTLAEILVPIIGNFTSMASYILDSQLPWDVHNDYIIECRTTDLDPYYAVMIPLETVPTRTVFFDQWADYKDFGRYKDEHGPIANHVPHEQWNSVLSHCRVKDRFFLSINKVYEWQRGDLVLFDRRQWHASDDYRSKLKNKRAIIMFTNR